MKNIIIIVLFTITFYSCTETEHKDYSIISGKILNSGGNKLILQNLFSKEEGNTREIFIKSDGTFIDTIPIDWNHKYSLELNKNAIELVLYKGFNLRIEFDSENIDSTLKISGNGDILNQYIQKKNKILSLRDEFDSYRKNEIDFLDFHDKIKKEKMELLLSQENLPKKFVQNEKSNIEYEFYYIVDPYQNMHRHYTDNPKFNISKKLDSTLNVYRNSLSFNKEDDYKFSYFYRRFINNSLKYQLEKDVDSLIITKP